MTDISKTRVGPLNTVGRVCKELGRLYRASRKGELPIGDAYRLAHILNVLRQCLEGGAIEQRLTELEESTQRLPQADYRKSLQ